MSEPIEPTPDGVRIQVHAIPRASRTELAGRHGDAIRIRLRAPPVDGAANEELIRFLRRLLQVPRAAIQLGTGKSSRRKLVLVSGRTVEQVRTTVGLRAGD